MVRRIYIVKSSRSSELFLVEDFPVHCYLTLFFRFGLQNKVCCSVFFLCETQGKRREMRVYSEMSLLFETSLWFG